MILGVAGYFMWYNFELPKIFIGETQRIEGKIYDISVGYGVRGRGYIQNVEFVYAVDNNNYIGRKKVDNKYGIQTKGNTVIIEVSKKNPGYYDVKGFKQDFSKMKYSKIKYLKSSSSEYEEILIENCIFNYKIIKNGGIETYSLTGLVKLTNDTISVNCFREIENPINKEMNERIFEKNKNILRFVERENKIINLNNLKEYKILSDERKNNNASKGTIKLLRE